MMLCLRASTRRNGRSRAIRPFLSLTRHLQTKKVTDSDIARLAAKPLHPLTLADLCSHGRPPLSEQDLLQSANFTLGILPVRLAHRIQALRALPYIVVANPNVNKIHNNYLHSLSTLLPYADHPIESLTEETAFTEVMADLVQTHANTIAVLARGFLEARKYITKDEITRFLDEHLRARIGTRLIAEQHLALHFSSQPHANQENRAPQPPDSYVGVIDTALKPIDIIHICEHTVGEICELKYGVRPTVQIIGSSETTITHIPMHLEYILTELLKNSFRATIEAGMEREPIEITIAPTPASTEQQDTGQSPWPDSRPMTHPIQPLTATPGVTLRIRDRGGGIDPANYGKLWEYGFTTFNEEEILEAAGGSGVAGLDALSGDGASGSSLAGLGYGLPLGRAYAEYFGGGIAVQSLWGWGTDVYLSLKGVGSVKG